MLNRKSVFAIAASGLALASLACNAALGIKPTAAPTQPLATLAVATATPNAPAASATSPAPTAAPSDATPLPAAGVLPAPLYFLNQTDKQIWRIEADGVRSARITDGTSPITGYDISPVDGSLAYVKDNTLFVADSHGGNPRGLVIGDPIDPNWGDSRIDKEIGSPHWSPDGQRISYGLGGVNIISLTEASVQTVLRSDPVPDHPAGGALFYQSGLWSPDGRRLLISYAIYPEGGSYLIYDLTNGTDQKITFPGLPCCNPSWSPDSQWIYLSNDSVGMVPAGLWRIPISTGVAETLASAPSDAQRFPLISYARVLSDGRLYYFYQDAGLDPAIGAVAWPATVTATRSDLDGQTGRAALRADSYQLVEALWAPDGRGSVIVKHSDDPNVFGEGALIWIDTANGPAVDLHTSGSMLHWGR